MIKINVIVNNKNWFNFIKKPNNYLDNKIRRLNLKKTIFFALYYFLEIKKLDTLIKNLEKKIQRLIYYHFHFKQKKILK